jgi:hypothetical protein
VVCGCGKSYKYISRYNSHIKKCPFYKKCPLKNENVHNDEIDINITNELKEIVNTDSVNIECNQTMKELLMTVLNDYKELVTKAIEQPKIINNSNIKHQQNNTSFSVKNYLNTECKGAMNLSDYVNQIKITFDDLIYMKDHGIVKSFENTFVKGLREMDKTLRPIHCSDIKRGNFYIKDEDNWEKDNENEKIIDTLRKITDQQCDVLKQWKIMNGDWLDNEIKQEHANIVTRKIVDIYGEQVQKHILNLLKQLNIKEGVINA